MKNTKPAALSSKAQSVMKRPEDLLRSSEIEEMFAEKDPGMITVLGKFEVSPMLYALTASQLEAIDRHLISGIAYTPAELIGDEWWTTFRKETEREFELCIKHFAAHPDATLVDLKDGTFTPA